MLDLNDKNVDIQITNDNRLWVNVDGACVLRVYGTKLVQVDDGRPRYKPIRITRQEREELIKEKDWGRISYDDSTYWNSLTGEIINGATDFIHLKLITNGS